MSGEVGAIVSILKISIIHISSPEVCEAACNALINLMICSTQIYIFFHFAGFTDMQYKKLLLEQMRIK